jgi:hypothetical protein
VNGTLTVDGVILTPPPGPEEEGTPVTLTATVPNGATGTVTFDDGTTVIGVVTIPTTTPSASGIPVTLVTTSLGPGTHSITAVFSGYANFPPATSAPITPQADYFYSELRNIQGDRQNQFRIGAGVLFRAHSR